jgi:hypothetical protein
MNQHSAIHNIEVGQSELQYNIDTNSSGYIQKRKGYELHRNIPIRLVNVTDRGSNWELVAHPSVDLLGVPSGPIVINGQAINGSGDLETVSFYWEQFDNLGAFTLTGTQVGDVWEDDITISQSDGLDLFVGVLKQDPLNSANNSAILTDEIKNVDNNDGTFEIQMHFESPEDFDNSTYTAYKPDASVLGVNAYYHTYAPGATGAQTINITQVTHGLSGDNFIVQVWQDDDGTGLHRDYVFPDDIVIAGNSDVSVDIDLDSTNPVHVYIGAVNDSYQAAGFIDASTGEGDPKQFCLTNVSTNTNFWALYRVDNTGEQTWVLPDEVVYDQATQTLCFDFYPTVDSVFKAVYLPGSPISAGVIVSKTDDSDTPIDTSTYDLSNADLALHGIDWEGVVVSSLTPEFSYVREVDEYKSTVYEKLVSVCSGDFWIEDVDTAYTLTASQSAEQAASVQYLTPYFGASALAQADGRGRGMDAAEITGNQITVASITNNKDGTADVITDALTGITGSVAGIITGTDKLTITGDEYAVYNNEHTITAVSELAGVITFTISVDGLKQHSPDSSGSPASCGIFTDYITMSAATFDDIQVGDIINNLGGLLGSVVFSLDDVNKRMWLDPVVAERLLPGSVDVTWDRITDTIFMDTVTNAVPYDIISLSGFTRRFKIISIDTANKSITINESVQISNFFGAATIATLDGRLALPLKPENNIAKDFPFAPTGEYSTEIAALNDSLYTSTYDRSVVKFDGTHISDAGIQEFPIYHHSWTVPKEIGTNDTDFGFISPNSIAGKVSAVTLNTDVTIVLTDAVPSTLYLGQEVSVESAAGSNILDGTISDIDRDTDTIIIDSADTTGFTANDIVSLFEPTSFGYYFRLEYTDRNNKIITGTPNSYVDAIITITRPSVIMHSVKLPNTANGATEWDRLKVSMYRTAGAPSSADVLPIFYKVDDTPALKGLEGSKASDAQVLGTAVISDTTSDAYLLSTDSKGGGTDFISNAQITNFGGLAVERPIAAARPPQSQYLLSAEGHMVYGNIKSQPTLLNTWAKNKSSIKDLVDTTVTLRATNSGSDYDTAVKFVNGSSTNVDVVDLTAAFKDTPANGSDFDTPADESADAGFIKLTLGGAAVTAGHASQYMQIISKGGSNPDYDNEFVGALVGWHKITGVSGTDTVWIRVPGYLADEFTVSEAIASLQCVLVTGNVVPCWDVVYGATPSQDSTLPNSQYDMLSRVTRNWAKAVNTVMADNAYYTRKTEELGGNPVSGLGLMPNTTLGDWAFARWGQTVGSGNIEITQQSNLSIAFRTFTTNAPDGFALFSNGYLSADPIYGISKVFPSRLAVSYQNYPESVDNPFADDEFKSFSAIDVNASDGQEITGMASFFGQSSTGAAQYAGTIVVFKTNSVYAVDIKTKAIQKLQSLGQGCTIPDSIASTDDTIFFANDTGIYKVTRDLNVKYVGDMVENYYKDLPKATLQLRGYGIADNFSLNYKFAVPASSSVNDEVIVYNFESMSKQAEGSWGLYNNVPLSSAKQTSSKFWFGNFKGRIWENRDAGNNTDYRDDDSAINATLIYGPQAFGDPGKSKIMSHVIIQYDSAGPSAATVSMGLDLDSNFTAMNATNAGEGSWKGVSIAYSPPPANAVYYQVKVEHTVKDEPCKINGIVFKVSIGNEQGIRQAADGKNGAKGG